MRRGKGQISFRTSCSLKVFYFTKYFKWKAPYYIQGVWVLQENDRKVWHSSLTISPVWTKVYPFSVALLIPVFNIIISTFLTFIQYQYQYNLPKTLQITNWYYLAYISYKSNVTLQYLNICASKRNNSLCCA